MGGKFFKSIWGMVKVCGAVLTLLLAIVYIAAAYGGMVDPAEDTKYAILCLGYPLLLVLLVAVMILWLVLRQWLIASIAVVALLVTAGPLTTYFPLNIGSPDLSQREEQNSFKLLTYNVMNFDDFDGTVHERNRTVQYILDTDADVVCLQEGSQEVRFTEIKVIRSILPELLERYPYYTRGIDDMVLLSKYPFEKCDDSVVRGREKVVSYNVHIGRQTVKIFNCHLQSIGLTMNDKEIYKQITEINGLNHLEPMEAVREVRSNLFSKLSAAFKARAEQARELRNLIDKSEGNVIVCGDFNDTPGSYSYRTVRGDDMRDAYLDCAFGPAITYHDNRFYFKIDHVLYRGNLRVVDIERGRIDASDHYPLLATFVLRGGK